MLEPLRGWGLLFSPSGDGDRLSCQADLQQTGSQAPISKTQDERLQGTPQDGPNG